MTVVLVGVSILAKAQSSNPLVEIQWVGLDWTGAGSVRLGLDQVPTNFVVQVSEDLETWHDQLDVTTRRDRTSALERGVSLGGESTRFYRVKSPGVSVESARALWQSHELQSYNFHFERMCLCSGIQQADIAVVDGQVFSATNVVYFEESFDPTWTPPEEPDLDELMTVEELFDEVIAAQSELDQVTVTYDPILGYPRRIAVDQAFWVIDDEYEYSVELHVPEVVEGP